MSHPDGCNGSWLWELYHGHLNKTVKGLRVNSPWSKVYQGQNNANHAEHWNDGRTSTRRQQGSSSFDRDSSEILLSLFYLWSQKVSFLLWFSIPHVLADTQSVLQQHAPNNVKQASHNVLISKSGASSSIVLGKTLPFDGTILGLGLLCEVEVEVEVDRSVCREMYSRSD